MPFFKDPQIKHFKIMEALDPNISMKITNDGSWYVDTDLLIHDGVNAGISINVPGDIPELAIESTFNLINNAKYVYNSKIFNNEGRRDSYKWTGYMWKLLPLYAE